MDLEPIPEPSAEPPTGFFHEGDRVVDRATGAKATVMRVTDHSIQIQYDAARGRRGAWHTVSARSIRHED